MLVTAKEFLFIKYLFSLSNTLEILDLFSTSA